jgi:tetratricopeptide (TPR) repeat protein
MTTRCFLRTTLLSLVSLAICQAAHGESAEALMAQGNVHYDKLQTKEALKYYLPAEKLDPKNGRLLARISREYRHLMSDASSKTEKLRLGGIAASYAEKAVAAAPNDVEAQLAIAITYGKLVPLQGNREKVDSSRKIKAAAEKAVRIDPSNDLGWHVLGRWHLVLAEVGSMQRTMAELVYGKLPPASYEEAARNFRKAIALNPNRLMHYVELGRTYADLGQKEEAKKYIRKGLQMKDTEKDDPETKAKGRELLKKLG